MPLARKLKSCTRLAIIGPYVVRFSRSSTEVLCALSNPGMLFSRERILSSVWGLNMDPGTNVVDVYIGRLRKIIDQKDDDEID